MRHHVITENVAPGAQWVEKNYRSKIPTDLNFIHSFNIKKKKNNKYPKVGYVKPRLVLTAEEESKMASYALKCAEIYFGLLPIEVKKLAYQCDVLLEAKKNISSSK